MSAPKLISYSRTVLVKNAESLKNFLTYMICKVKTVFLRNEEGFPNVLICLSCKVKKVLVKNNESLKNFLIFMTSFFSLLTFFMFLMVSRFTCTLVPARDWMCPFKKPAFILSLFLFPYKSSQERKVSLGAVPSSSEMRTTREFPSPRSESCKASKSTLSVAPAP